MDIDEDIIVNYNKCQINYKHNMYNQIQQVLDDRNKLVLEHRKLKEKRRSLKSLSIFSPKRAICTLTMKRKDRKQRNSLKYIDLVLMFEISIQMEHSKD